MAGQITKSNVPRVKFLECYVYTYYEGDESEFEINFLVEKQLDHNEYHKLNDNKEGVDGQKHILAEKAKEATATPLKTLKGLKPIISETIVEVDSENEDDFSDDKSLQPISSNTSNLSSNKELVIMNKEVPQAFSHFTCMWSKREKIVCDLQGVLDTSQKPPVFEFTDPVIHYKSKSGRKYVFGRTDQGQKGIDNFFKTHKCNTFAKLLGFRLISGSYLVNFNLSVVVPKDTLCHELAGIFS